MFPVPPGKYQKHNLTPIPLPEPVEIEFTFVDGPFDGHKSTAIVRAELDTRFTVVMKNDDGKFVYRYAGENTFKYEGKYEECPAPSSSETAQA
jgi:hypothetical protein